MGNIINGNEIKFKFVKNQKIDSVKTVTLSDIGFKYDAPIYCDDDNIENKNILHKFYEKTYEPKCNISSKIELRYLDLIYESDSLNNVINILLYEFKKYNINENELILYLKSRSLYGIDKNLAVCLIEEFEYIIKKILPRSIQDLFYFSALDTNGAYWLFFDLAVKKMDLTRYDNQNKNNYRHIKDFVENEIKKLILENKSLQEIYDTTCATKALIKSVIKSMKSSEFAIFMGSKGERLVEFALLNFGLNYKREVYFEDFKEVTNSKFNGRYDFVIYDNKQPKCIVEFDGQQHFKFVKRFHINEDGFKEQQYRDIVKNLYCELKKINLIRIPYNQINNIKSILLENNLLYT